VYIPAAFAEPDPDVLRAFVEAHPLGALVTDDGAGGLHATHLPLLLDRTRGPHGVLQGHVARANPHALADGRAALVIFAGPDAYVTVGVELPIARLDGKWKMSRNRPAADVAGVIAGLAASDDAGARAAAVTVAERRPRSKR
jgi:predicted FMN-binding regulatory protein PaiB